MLNYSSIAVVAVSQFVDLSESLLLVLMHSFWQVAVIAIVVAGLLRLIPAGRTNLRYGVAVSSLLLVVFCSLTTWSILRLDSPTEVSTIAVESVQARSLGNASATANTGVSERALAAVSPLMTYSPWIIGLWVIGCVVMLFRAFRGMAEVRILLRESTPTEQEIGTLKSLQAELHDICQSLGMRQSVALQRCSNVVSPAVVGIFWPVVLVPASMLSGSTLTKEEWRIILAHELAHVRRFDGLVNLAQMLIESVLFFNPCVWWLNRQVRIEREACCDALAAQVSGRPLSVARTLLNVAESISRAAQSAATDSRLPMPALAFADSTDPGSLSDRVNRLATPDQVPRGRVSWIGFTWLGLLLACLVMVSAAFALQKGTDVAVRSAAAMLTPQERVNELARLQAVNTGHVSPLADASPGTESPGSVNVHIIVKTEDGSPIPAGLNVGGAHWRPGYSSSIGLAHEKNSVPLLELDHAFGYGLFQLAASAKGFAPAVSEQISIRPDTDVPTIELILSKGFEKTIRIEDENGDPISDIQIEVAALMVSQGMKMGMHFAKEKPTSIDGVISVKHISDAAVYRLTVQSPGWEYEQREMKLQEGGEDVFQVRRATPTLIQIVDDATGQPVEAASIQVVGWNGKHDVAIPHSRMGDPRGLSNSNKWTYGKSEADGTAAVDMLNRDRKYLLAVRADGYRLEFVNSVRPGADLGTVRLLPAIVFEGQVVGDLSALPDRKKNGKRVYRLSYRNSLQFGSHTHSGTLSVLTDENGHFQIDNLLPGGMEFSLPKTFGTVKMDSNESRKDIVIDLAAMAAGNKTDEALLPTRQVVVKLNGLSDDAKVRGELKFWWALKGRSKLLTLPIVDRSATVEIPVGALFNVSEKGVVGCTFAEVRRVEVTEGKGPQTVDVAAQPAGGVFGTVVRADGTAATNASISIIEVEEPPSGRIDPNPSVQGNGSSFFRTVPFGGRYVVLVREFNDIHTVWAVSDSFPINADNPIQELKLKLGTGTPTTVRVVDHANQPIANTAVELSISHSCNHGSHSASTSGLTDSNGIADLGLVQLRGDAGETQQKVSVTVKPSKTHAGWRDFVDQQQDDFTIEVDRGVTASGIVLDVKTDKPVVNTRVVAYPADFDSTNYHGHLKTQTDAAGRFQFRGMQSIRYVVSAPDAAPAEAVVTFRADGGRSYKYPNGPREQFVDGGSDKEHEIRVQDLSDRQ